MPGSTGIGSAINPVLDGLFYSILQEHTEFKGLLAAPMIKTLGVSGQYVKLAHKLNLNLDGTDEAVNRTIPMGPEATSRPTGVNFTTGSVELDRYADSVFVSDRVAAHWRASGNFDVMVPALEQLHQIVRGIHEYSVFGDIYSTSGNFTTTTNGGDWGTSTVACVSAVTAEMRAIKSLIYKDPTDTFINREVADALLLNDDIKARMSRDNMGGQTIATIPALQAFWKSQFNMNLHIADVYHENTSGNQAALLGEVMAIVYLSDRPGDPSFCNTFVQDVGGMAEGTLANIRTVELDDPAGTKVIADQQFKVSVQNPDAGSLITSVLT